MPKHGRYQDYVISNGKFVGDFELMYQEHEDPWEQSTSESHTLEKKIGINLINEHRFRNIAELGCGFGHYLRDIADQCPSAERLIGTDISKTAIEKATNRSKDYKIDFIEASASQVDWIKSFNPNIILMTEITWYILDTLEETMKNIRRASSPNTFLFHTLMTYAPGEQRYGRQYFTNIEEITEYFSSHIDPYQWGKLSRKEHRGGGRTFLFGPLKSI